MGSGVKKPQMNWFEFLFPPSIGTRIRYRKTFITLRSVTPYTRKDGAPSYILTWEDDAGRVGTTGLKAMSVQWQKAITE